jgi:hypothetical protein
MAKIDRQNELVPLGAYSAGLVLAWRAAKGSRGSTLLLAGRILVYLGVFALAAARELRSARAVVWVPVIRVAADLAKLHGFLGWTLRIRRGGGNGS